MNYFDSVLQRLEAVIVAMVKIFLLAPWISYVTYLGRHLPLCLRERQVSSTS